MKVTVDLCKYAYYITLQSSRSGQHIIHSFHLNSVLLGEISAGQIAVIPEPVPTPERISQGQFNSLREHNDNIIGIGHLLES